MTSTTLRFVRLRDLEVLLWARKHHRETARRIAAQLKQMRRDNPNLRNYL